ncbi:uncharacterized protein LODBEIA_P30750 [Lodderomyces beijingensis]|uniref:BTB domain-containing protein n=1 Tax=Lodderomyces beijingensis TaxID=1775926 RepID=A0ABP0ZPM0_9ASCO
MQSQQSKHSAVAHDPVSFEEYIHYAAPKTSQLSSVFPPSACTLGRIAFNRYSDQLSDFEIVAVNGERIPVSMRVLLDRWGRYFAHVLARGYVSAAERFEGLGVLKRPNNEQANFPATPLDVPKFRIPFQNSTDSLVKNLPQDDKSKPVESPGSSSSEKSDTRPSFPDTLLELQLRDLPPQPPKPEEPVPPVPTTQTYRKSPRASLLHTLSVLRNIPASKSPKTSPYPSPRASLSAQSGSHDMPRPSDATERGGSDIGSALDQSQLESPLIPRKLYIPTTTPAIKSFCEFLYTGMIGNYPLTIILDNFFMAKYYEVPSLYDTIREALVKILSRKEKLYVNDARVGKYTQFIPSLNKGELNPTLMQILSDVMAEQEKEQEKDELKYLNANRELGKPGSRSFLFDKSRIERESDTATLSMPIEELMNRDSAVPLDSVIDVIQEVSILVDDMNLFLRTANLKIMRSLVDESG